MSLGFKLNHNKFSSLEAFFISYSIKFNIQNGNNSDLIINPKILPVFREIDNFKKSLTMNQWT